MEHTVEKPHVFCNCNTLNEILHYPGIAPYMKYLCNDWLIEQIPEEEPKDGTLEEIAAHLGKTEWGEPFSVIIDQIKDAANTSLDLMENHAKILLPLWKLAKMQEGNTFTPQMQKAAEEYTKHPPEKGICGAENVFLVAPNAGCDEDAARPTEEAKKKRPAVILCPGGGYEDVCFTNEGSPMQNFMEEQGYASFMLNYRVAPNEYPLPQMDLALAILFVRSHAEQYDIDPANITVMGSSAGGHLCACLGVFHEEIKKEVEKELHLDAKSFGSLSARPDQICLNYPVISFVHEPHEGSFQKLTGGKEELREALSIETRIDESYPKTFLWACADDETVPPSNTRRMAEALEAKGVPCKWEIYPTGGHGCGLALTKSAKSWSKEMVAFFRD